MSEFVRASRLYNAETGETVPFDWSKMQSVADSLAETKRAATGVEDRR